LDFKVISRTAFFSFGVINKSLLKKIIFEKTQNNDLFISPKWKNAVLEMALKSFILSHSTDILKSFMISNSIELNNDFPKFVIPSFVV
jgi:hypothetical protein